MKKTLAFLLSMALLYSFACFGASAEEPAEEVFREEDEIVAQLTDESLKDEALALIGQARDIFDSGTFTLKGRERLAGPMSDTIVPSVMVYDKENDRKLYEINLDTSTFDKGMSRYCKEEMGWPSWWFWLFVKGISLAKFLFVGNQIRGMIDGTQRYASFPQRLMYTDDVSDDPKLGDINISLYLSFYIEEDSIEVTKEGNRIRLLYPYGNSSKLFEFTNGNLSHYKEVHSDGSINEYFIESLSPVADPSYFSTKWMIKIPIGKILYWLYQHASNESKIVTA